MAKTAKKETNVAQQDERWGQPRLLVVGHDVAIAIVFPQFIGNGFHIYIDVTVSCREERDNVLKQHPKI